MFDKWFKKDEIVAKLMEALAKDPDRVDDFYWDRIYNDVYSNASYRDQKWMRAQRKMLKNQALLTRISVADLTNGESEIPSGLTTPTTLHQPSLAQHVALHQQALYQQTQQSAIHNSLLGTK
jgi:hypothetical protein